MVTHRQSNPRAPQHTKRPARARRLTILFVALFLAGIVLTTIILLRRMGLESAEANLSPKTESQRASARRESIALSTVPAEQSVEQLRRQCEQVANELLERFPKSPSALHIAATQYAELQQYAKAAEIWQRCIHMAPQHAGPHVGLATAAMQRGDDADAIAILENAQALGCRTAEVFYRLAMALQNVGRLQQAESVARQGHEAFPQDVDLLTALGKIQLQLTKLDGAETSLREAIRLEPNSSQAHFVLASVTTRLGKPDEAAEHRRRYTELKSDNPLTQQRFQVVYEATLRGIVIMTLCNAAAEYQRQGQPQEAERLYRKALELNPNDPDTCRWLASLYHALGRTADAHILQQRLVELEPNRVENYLNLASLSAQLGQDEAAEQMLLTAIRVEPRLAISYRSLASLYLGRGQHADACKFAEKAVQLEPSVDGYLLLAVASKQLRDVSGAQAALRHARRLAPNDPRVQNFDP